MKLGFIGTGTITGAVVAGLRNSGVRHEILLSPRSEVVSKALTERFANVTRARSNASVADQSDVVFLAVRPTQIEAALEGVTFRPGQTLVSFVTGLSVPELAALAPHSSVCRVLPLPAIEHGQGPVICYPAHPIVTELFARLGDLIVAGSEQELRTLGCVSGFMSTYFELQRALVRWLEDSDVPRSHASLYVRSMLAGLAETARRSPEELQGELPRHHETRGGLNERVRRHMRERRWFEEPGRAFDVLKGLSRSGLGES